MNLLSLDEEEARSLGVNVSRMRKIIIAVSTLITAVSVSTCGIIGWVGLLLYVKLQVTNGTFGYRKKSSILRNINLYIDVNTILTILGPNGIGKTTLLKCIMLVSFIVF